MAANSVIFNICVDFYEPDMMSARTNTRQVGDMAAEVATVCRYRDGEREPGRQYYVTPASRARITRTAHRAQVNRRARDE